MTIYLTQGYLDGYENCLSEFNDVVTRAVTNNPTTAKGILTALNEIITCLHTATMRLDDMYNEYTETNEEIQEYELCDCDECEEKQINLTLIIGGKQGGQHE